LLELSWLIPASPLLGFVLLVVFGKRLGEPVAGWVATIFSFISFIATVFVFFGLKSLPTEERFHIEKLFNWIDSGSFSVDAGLLVDPLSVTMCLFVTGVGTLIHLYSIGYMHGDANFSKFFVYLNLFIASMLLLVLGDNLLITFLGWEGVGACSYLLISFWFEDKDNASAGKKAFVTNRVGDFGFMIATFLVFTSIGSINYDDIAADASTISGVTATAIVMLFVLAATGKSAQLPLFVWLPDAMAGPTPVSALIHAATMVTSGVFLLIRLNPLLAEADLWATGMISWIGAITAFVAATAAVSQNDIKKVLAYSTVSQLGYLFMAVGVGGYVAAIFHMITHAFFKALLFLGAGSVIHGMHHEQDMRKMGGLRPLMPITGFTFIIGWLAIAGVPPFSGFWSKDEILLYLWNADAVGGKYLWVIGLVTALLTAFYMTRQVLMTFFGEQNFETTGDHAVKPHESPKLMTIPLMILSGLAVVAGLLNLPLKNMHYLADWIEPSLFGNEVHLDTPNSTKWILALVAIAVGLTAIALAGSVYYKKRFNKVEPQFFADAWSIDSSYARFFGGPGRLVFDALSWFDRTVIDGLVKGVGKVSVVAGQSLRPLQTGYIRSYGLSIVIGTLAVAGWFIWRLFS